MSAVPESPALSRWSAHFRTDPVPALEGLLAGRVNLGPYSRARPADALLHLLASPADVVRADEALQAWLKDLLGKPAPGELSGKRFAGALVEAYRAVERVPLPATRNWLAAHHGAVRAWLRGFYFGRSRDPEAVMLVALAHNQTDRALQSLWLGLAQLSGGTPVEHALHGLTGLRLMPKDDAGNDERGLPKALLRGILELGEALARQGGQRGKVWLRELDFLAVVYPMSKEQWGQRFRETLQARPVARPVQRWLDQRYPAAFRQSKKPVRGFLAPPHRHEFTALLRQVKDNLAGVRPQLQVFLDRHRHYCRESGDSYYLVRTFCNLGKRLLDQDPAWARELAHEAARWDPQDHYNWSLLARALGAEGDWRRAEAVYWHARRRFPHNVQSHSQLAHALLLKDQAELGEAVYREAICLFPGNPVCYADLAHTLRVTGRLDEAVVVYREARQLFQQDEVLACGLTDTFIDSGRLDEAREALTWAEQVASPDDPKLAQIRRRLELILAGESIKLKKLDHPYERPGGDLSALAGITGTDLSNAPALGRVTLWRRQGNGGLERARSELEVMPEDSAQLIEAGLLHAAAKGWPAAAAWFDARWERYPGDGVLRVHRQRAHARAGDPVDWSLEHQRYPYLLPVILTEERGKPPRLSLDPNDPELTDEQRQDLWFNVLVEKEQLNLRDLAEEDLLAARHLV